MIVMENARRYGRGKKKRRGKGKGRSSFASSFMLFPSRSGVGAKSFKRNYRRNGDEDEDEMLFGDLGEAMPNRKSRGKKSKKRSKKGRKSALRRLRKYARKGYGRKAARRGRKGRKSARRSYKKRGRKAYRKSYGRKSARRGRKGRKSARRNGWGRKRRGYGQLRSYIKGYGARRIKVRRSRRGRGLSFFARNGMWDQPAVSYQGHQGKWRKVRGGAWGGIPSRIGPGGMKIPRSDMVGKSSRQLSSLRSHRRPITGSASMWEGAGSSLGSSPRSRVPVSFSPSLLWGGFMPPGYKARVRKPKMPKYTPEAADAYLAGITPRQLIQAARAAAEGQAEATFPDAYSFKAWFRAMMKSKRFRRYYSKYVRGAKRFRGSRNTFFLGGRGRRRSRRYGRRRYRRNGFMQAMANPAYETFGGMLMPAAAGIASFLMSDLAGTKIASALNLSGIGSLGLQVAVAAGVALLANKFMDGDVGKGVVVGALAAAGVRVVGGAFAASDPAPAAGYGGIGYSSQMPQYQGYGQFQQAAAGYDQFQQAAAGYGEYYQGTGEYYSQDGSMTPVSNFGEYVSSGLQVQGYGDYEVVDHYATGADGYGMVNDGVRPDANFDQEFNMMEAAAGLSGAPTTVSDYVPTGQAAMVRSTESQEDTGIFDGGGPNGIFGN